VAGRAHLDHGASVRDTVKRDLDRDAPLNSVELLHVLGELYERPAAFLSMELAIELDSSRVLILDWHFETSRLDSQR